MDSSPDTAPTIREAAAAVVAAAPALATVPAILPRGAQVGRFVVLDRLGQGGMGIVYAAFDPELDRKLALKLIREPNRDGGRDGAAVRDRSDRLAREAKAMARLTHPNVVSVYDVGRHESELYVAMELVDGSTLREWSRVAKPDWRRILDVMRGAARGLAAAHAAGIVHRDFKPDNVLVDREGHARVADFGLARELKAHGSTSVLDQLASLASGSETAEGTVVGTPTYMAPELLAGGTATAASDQFSFFVTMHELLAGGRPFAGRDLHELAAAMAMQRVQTPLPREVPGWLRKIVMRGLAADPAARWPSMAAIVALLTRDRIKAWMLGVGGFACVAASVGATLSLGAPAPCEGASERFARVWADDDRDAVRKAFAGTAMPWADAAAERNIAAVDAYGAAWIAAHRDACEATEVRHEQSSELLDARMACLQRARASVEALAATWATPDIEVLASADAAVGALPVLEACADATLLRTEGVQPAAADRERVDAAEQRIAVARIAIGAMQLELAETELANASELLAGLDAIATTAALELERARLLLRRGDYRAAGPALIEAVSIAERGGHDRVRLTALLELGDFEAGTLADHRAARQRFAAIDALWRRLGSPASDDYARAWLDQTILRGEGDLEQALVRGREAFDLAREHAPESAPSAHSRIAAVLMELARFPEAEREGKAALAEAEAQFGASHPTTAQLRMSLGGIYGRQKKWAEAEPLLERALADTRAAFGEDHPRVADVMLQLGSALRHRAEDDRATELTERALAIREAKLDPMHPKLADVANTYAVHLMDRGHFDRALPLYDRALSIRRHVYGDRHPLVARVLTNRAIVYGQIGRPADAEADLREALEIREASIGPSHPDTAHTREALGNRVRESGRIAEAEVLLRRALADNQRALPAGSDTIITNMVNLGLLQLDLKQWDEATKLCGDALAQRETKLGKDHPNLVYPLDCLGNAALGRGDTTAATPVFERSLAILQKHPERHAVWGEASYGLARAVAKSEPARARMLAADALTHYRALGTGRAQMITEIEAFIPTIR